MSTTLAGTQETPLYSAVGVGTNLMQRNIMKQYMDLEPEATPLLTLLNGAVMDGNVSPLAMEASPAPVFETVELAPTPTTFTVANAVGGGSGDTSVVLTASAANQLNPRDMVQVFRNGVNPVGEVLRITAITANGLTLTVATRSGTFGGTRSAIAAGAKLKYLGSDVGEGGVLYKGPVYPIESIGQGACQFHKVDIAATSHRLSFQMFYGQVWPSWVKNAIGFMKKGIENMCWYNQLADITSTSSIGSPATDWDFGLKLYTSDGIWGKVTQNVFDQPNCSYEEFVDCLGAYTRRNSGVTDYRLVAFAPERAMSWLPRWGTQYLQTQPGANQSFGLQYSEIIVPSLPGGKIRLYRAPTLDEGIFEQGLVILSIGSTSGKPHIGMKYMQEVDGPRKRNWSLAAMDESMLDITQTGDLARIVKTAAVVQGLCVNLPQRHMVFKRFAPGIV